MTKKASLDAQPKVGLAFDVQTVALRPRVSSPETPWNRAAFAVEHSASPSYKGHYALAFLR
ncbi:hypothetical protein HFO09_25260 [Rhizobium laguerreae]|uniref:hypothetical protein n=1 Tax=Rhizobium laguerreae TaxID=1076926 RepID=UPI001C8FF92E|nr:hypothetical protein [Rhizobium laguerreae]MBY3257471.1 hypothetical protein [Rhizobium laguerreae]MBY3285567.1 hypothetical protein [Rhizobium laguerreae]MBY3292341.1 hypothetical protein [Rhizobium laguerreae]